MYGGIDFCRLYDKHMELVLCLPQQIADALTNADVWRYSWFNGLNTKDYTDFKKSFNGYCIKTELINYLERDVISAGSRLHLVGRKARLLNACNIHDSLEVNKDIAVESLLNAYLLIFVSWISVSKQTPIWVVA